MHTSIPSVAAGHQLHYESLAADGRSYCFPCDSHGRVDLDALSDPDRNDYFFARVVVGNTLDLPRVACPVAALPAGMAQ